MKFEKQNIKMVEYKNVSFSTIIALLTLVTLLLELFWPASYFTQKPPSWTLWLECSHGKCSILITKISETETAQLTGLI